MKYNKRIISLILVTLLLIQPVISLSAGGQSDVNVNIPFDQIYGLIDALQEAGNNVVGQAGVEIRASIDKISKEIEARMDQLKEIGTDLWKMMYNDISKEIKSIEKFIKDYTKQVNQMVKDRIKQIDKALAERLDQISDTITDTITQIDNVIQRTIKTAEESAINVINAGEKSIITVMDNVSVAIVRMSIIIVLVILLVIILVLAWKNVLPKTLPAIVITSIVGVLVIAGSLVFLLNNTVMAYIFGRKIELTQPEVAIAKGNDAFDDFISDVERGSTVTDLKAKSTLVIDNLLSAKYVTKDPEIIKKIDLQLSKVYTLLYPPPKPNSKLTLGTTSKYYTEELKIINETSKELRLKPEILYQTPERLQINPNNLRLNIR